MKIVYLTPFCTKLVVYICIYIHTLFRYDLGSEHAREKDRYAAREREEVIRRSRERKVADTKVCRFV